MYVRAAERLSEEGILVDDGGLVRVSDHSVVLSEGQESDVTKYLDVLASEPWAPPTDHAIDSELLGLLLERGDVVKVNETVVFSTEAYADMRNRIVEHLNAHGSVTVADARTIFGTSRKYVLPLLEYLDQQRITRRVGDERVLR